MQKWRKNGVNPKRRTLKPLENQGKSKENEYI